MGDQIKKSRPSRKGVMTPRPGLTLSQEKFVENMAKDLPLKTAMEGTGYSEANSVILGLQLMKKPHIKEAIAKRKLEAANFANITPEQVLGATVQRAFCSIDDAFDEDGNFDIALARQTGAINLVKSYENNRGKIKVTFYDNAQAQDKLGNYLGMEVAPKDNNDTNSLKEGINQVAKQLANGVTVTNEHRKEAWKQISEWIKDNRARYSRDSIQEISKEFAN